MLNRARRSAPHTRNANVESQPSWFTCWTMFASRPAVELKTHLKTSMAGGGPNTDPNGPGGRLGAKAAFRFFRAAQGGPPQFHTPPPTKRSAPEVELSP